MAIFQRNPPGDIPTRRSWFYRVSTARTNHTVLDESSTTPHATHFGYVTRRICRTRGRLPTYPSAARNAHTTTREKKSHLKVHILPALGDLRLDQITREKLDKFIATLSKKTKGKTNVKPLSSKRIKNVMATLRKILVTAVEWEVLPYVPKFPKLKTEESDFDFFVRNSRTRRSPRRVRTKSEPS